MKEEFFSKLEQANSVVTKSEMRDSIKSETKFEVDGHTFILEIEKFLSWGHLLQMGVTNIPIEVNVLLNRKDSGDEHYMYCTLDIMNDLGIVGVQQKLNKYVQDEAKEMDLTKDDLDYAVEIFNKRTDGFNRTINRYTQVHEDG